MKKYNFELPKYRLQLHLKLIKRRKPLLAETILPTKTMINKKYRSGTFVGRLIRYFADQKSIRKIFAANFVLVAMLASFAPQTPSIQAQAEQVVIESPNTLLTQKGMQYPVETVKINQGYKLFHPAIDFGGTKGIPIKPIEAGVVSYAGWDNSGYGNLVVLTHAQGLESYYAHLSKIEVTTGQSVNINTEIGQMGSTGQATGVHLHLEIHQNGSFLNPLTVLSR